MRSVSPKLVLPSLLVLAACAAKPPHVEAPPPHGSEWAVATENASATHAAEAILEKGGSAADAAVAAALALDVAVPASTGIGGGGFAMIWDPREKKAIAIDFRECAPAKLDVPAFDRPTAPPGTKIGVPGGIAGFAEIHRRWGKKAWGDDVAPAIELAEKGFPVSPHMARALAMFGHKIGPVPGLGAIFVPGGKPARAGDLVTWPALAKTLKAVAAKGASAFYEGEIARSLVDATRAAGGWLDDDDLRSYRAVERKPVDVAWEGLEVHTFPPPSAGGLMLAEILGMFSKADVVAHPARSADAVHELAEAMRAAYADRVQLVGDPDKAKVDLTAALAPAKLRARRVSIDPRKTRPPLAFVKEDHGTTHLVVADADGMVVSLTTTLNNAFGSAVYAESSGVILDDELDDFLSPGDASALGVTDAPGRPRPGARPPSSMAPTIVVRGGEPMLALGGAGGLRIATGIPQVALAVLARGEPVRDAVRDPRFHVAPDGHVVLETGELDEHEKADLASRGETVREEPNMASIDALTRTRDATGHVVLEAAAEPRRWGLALAR